MLPSYVSMLCFQVMFLSYLLSQNQSNIEIVKGSSALINATSEVGEAVRAGNAVIQTSKNKLETEPLDLNDILEEINKELVENFEFFKIFEKIFPFFIGWRLQNLFFSFFRSFKTGEGQIIIWKSFRTYLEQVFAKIKILNGVKNVKLANQVVMR